MKAILFVLFICGVGPSFGNVVTYKEKIPDESVNLYLMAENETINNNLMELNRRQNYLKLLDLDTTNDDWLVIQRRMDGSEDFDRSWEDYQRGFGNKSADFFIGLEQLYNLTANEDSPQELLIIMEDFENNIRYARYDLFKLGCEHEKYALKALGRYKGDAGDALSYHKGQKFSTKDHDNDPSFRNCAKMYRGGWWFHSCYASHLNGPYLKGKLSSRDGINWQTWRGWNYSLKFVEMLIRSKS